VYFLSLSDLHEGGTHRPEVAVTRQTAPELDQVYEQWLVKLTTTTKKKKRKKAEPFFPLPQLHALDMPE
jgi:hypothetical protein